MDIIQGLVELLKDSAEFLQQPPLQMKQAVGLTKKWSSQLQSTEFQLSILGDTNAYKSLLPIIDNLVLADGIQLRYQRHKEEAEDTLKQKAWLNHVGGYLFFTHATQVFPQTERMHISALLGERDSLQARFIVTNMHLIEQEEKEELRTWVKKLLARYFSDEHGNLNDEQYEECSIYIAQDDPNEVAKFETNIREWLNNPQLLNMAKATSATQNLIYILGLAKQKLEKECQQHQCSIAKLQEEIRQLTRAEAKRREQQQEHTDQIIALRDRIKFVTQSSLVRHIDKMESRWEAEAPHFFNIDDLTLPTIGNLAISASNREKKVDELRLSLERYLQNHFTEWSQELPLLIEHEIAASPIDVNPVVQLTTETLDNLSQIPTNLSPGTINEGMLATLLQTHLKAWIGVGESSIANLIMRAVIITIVITSRTFITISGMAAWTIFEAVQINRIKRTVKDGILDNLRRNLFSLLRSEVHNHDALQSNLNVVLDNVFRESTNEFLDSTDEQSLHQLHQLELTRLEEEITGHEYLLSEYRKCHEELLKLAERGGVLVYGKPFDAVEVDNLYQAKEVIFGEIE